MIRLNGVPAEYMLMALYDLSQPQGRGWMAALSAPDRLDYEKASAMLRSAGFPARDAMFDYLGGRPIKVHFVASSGDVEVHRVDLYDRDAGPGAASRAYDLAVDYYTEPRKSRAS